MAVGKYGRVSTELKDIPENEPVFILRAQDKLAPTAVRLYATLRGAMGNAEAAKNIMDFAELMDAWPKKKWPD